MKKKLYVAAGAVLAVLAVATTFVIVNSTALPKNSSDFQLFIIDQLGNPLPSESPKFIWNDNVLGSASPSKPVDLMCPEGSTSTQVFVSNHGDERKIESWLASGESSFSTETNAASLPNLKLSGMINGNPNMVKATGGDLSFGLACLKGNASEITAIAYRYLHVSAGSGDWLLLPIK